MISSINVHLIKLQPQPQGVKTQGAKTSTAQFDGSKLDKTTQKDYLLTNK